MTEEVKVEKLGIKETSEMIDAVEKIAVAGMKISKGGIGMDDLVHLVALAKEMDQLMEGFKGIGMIDDEIKDLDQVEIMALVTKMYGMVKAILDARK